MASLACSWPKPLMGLHSFPRQLAHPKKNPVNSFCAISSFFCIIKQVCHRWMCQLSSVFYHQAGVPSTGVPTLFIFFTTRCATDVHTTQFSILVTLKPPFVFFSKCWFCKKKAPQFFALLLTQPPPLLFTKCTRNP